MKGYRGLIFVIFILLVVSCRKENKNQDSEIRERYFNLENLGWKSRSYTQVVDDIGFTAIEVPIQYYLAKSQGIENLKHVDSLYEENKRERVIEFIFQQDEEKDLLGADFTGLNYTDGVKYMSFGLDKDFYVVTSKKDTIQCSGVNFERNYKIAPFQKVLIFFSGIDPNDKIQLIYNDYLFKKGTLKFKFKDPFTPIAL